MSVERLEQLLTPHLASTMPLLASLMPYLLGLGILTLAGASLLAVRTLRFAARLSEDHEVRSRGRRAMLALRNAERWLKQAQIATLILGVVAVAGWLTLWTRRDVPELTELVFIVLGVGVLAPIYFGAKTLSISYGRAAKILDAVLGTDKSGS